MTFNDYITRVSHREHEVWVAWLEMDMDNPSRSDYYLMQIASEIVKVPVRVWGKNMDLKASEMRMTFVATTQDIQDKNNPGGVNNDTEIDPEFAPPKRVTKENLQRYKTKIHQAVVYGPLLAANKK